MIIDVMGGISVGAQTSSVFVHVFRHGWNVWKEPARSLPRVTLKPPGTDAIQRVIDTWVGQSAFKMVGEEGKGLWMPPNTLPQGWGSFSVACTNSMSSCANICWLGHPLGPGASMQQLLREELIALASDLSPERKALKPLQRGEDRWHSPPEPCL